MGVIPTEDLGSIAVVGAVALGLGGVITKMASALIAKSKAPPRPSLTQDERDDIKAIARRTKDILEHVEKITMDTGGLVKDHSPLDIDGVRLWYVPRSWGELLKANLALTGELVKTIQHLVDHAEDKDRK